MTAAASAAKTTVEKRSARKKARALGRKKTTAKLVSDKEFAKGYFEGKAKRANDKKVAFRKKKARKK